MQTTPERTLDEFTVFEWRDLAACNSHDPNLFFPAGETGPAVQQIQSAKQICTGCGAREDCLDYALETNQINGIWGGLTEDERRPVRRRWLTERRRTNL